MVPSKGGTMPRNRDDLAKRARLLAEAARGVAVRLDAAGPDRELVEALAGELEELGYQIDELPTT